MSAVKFDLYKNFMPNGLYTGKMPDGHTFKIQKKGPEFLHEIFRHDGTLESSIKRVKGISGLKTTFCNYDKQGKLIPDSTWSRIG